MWNIAKALYFFSPQYGAFVYPVPLVPKESESAVEEVHYSPDKNKADNVRKQGLQESKPTTNHQKQQRFHIRNHVPERKPEACREG